MAHVTDWISKNPVLFSMVLWPLVTGLVTWLFKPRTPEQYAAMPSFIRSVLKLLGALGLDAPHVLEGIKELLKLPAPAQAKTPIFATQAVKNANSLPPPAAPPPAPPAA